MRETIKVFCVLALMVGSLTAVVVWVMDKPGPGQWFLRIAAPILAVGGLGWFLRMHFQPGKVPDYLHQRYGEYFYRDGFAFALGPIEAREGTAWLEVGFQNQHAHDCLARICLRPARNFFLQRSAIPPLRIEIRCEPAAFGIAVVPFPLPRLVQGKKQMFDLGTSVVYPQGPGELLRYRNWTAVLDDDRFGGDLPLAGELLKAVVTRQSHVPTAQILQLPSGVREEIPEAWQPKITTHWRLGDELLPTVDAVLKRAAANESAGTR